MTGKTGVESDWENGFRFVPAIVRFSIIGRTCLAERPWLGR